MRSMRPAQIALLKMVRTGLHTRDPGQLAQLEELVRQKYLSRRDPEPSVPGDLMPLQSYALTAAGQALLAEERQ